MEIFVRRTIHTYIEVYEHSLSWHYAQADPEFGYMQSKELEEYLIALLDKNEVDIVRGYHKENKYIQVRTKRISKAHFLENVLLTLRSVDVITDFILAVGDDESDESLFVKANRLEMPIIYHGKTAVFTTVIGKRKTEARVCVDNLSELMHILKRLARSSVKEKKYYSTSDLYHLGTTKKAVQMKESRDTDSYSRYQSREMSLNLLSHGKSGSDDMMLHTRSKSSPESKAQDKFTIHQPIAGSLDSLASPRLPIVIPPIRPEERSSSVHEYLDQLGQQEEDPLMF